MARLGMAFGVACAACLVVFMAKPVFGQGVIFDVTKYGAVADGQTDNSKAFLDAWKATCAYQGDATFLVPNGTFFLNPVIFNGPCYNNNVTTVEIIGKLLAPPDLNAFSKFGWIEFNQLHEVTIRGGGTLDGQGSQSWQLTTCPTHRTCKNLPTSLRFNEVNNATVSNLYLVNSKGFHMNFHRCANVLAHDLDIRAPEDSPNTDGIHISGTHNISITHSVIGTGDDCISVGPGATNVHLSNITCGPGHGISVGSLGKYKNEMDVAGIAVKNCTLTRTENGLRIKTWPGAPASKALNFTFEDIIMNNVSNPIIIDQEYCPIHHCKPEPSGVKIAGVSFKRVRGTSQTPVAVHLVCSEATPCENVQLEDIELSYVNENGGDQIASSTCSNVKALFSGAQKPAPCTSA